MNNDPGLSDHPSADDAPSSEHEERLAALLGELMDRANRGEEIDIHQICDSHPELAEEIRELWGAVMIADAAGSESMMEADAKMADAAQLEIQLPYRFGDYELLEEIGRGGMGVVYRARQHSLNREVALKMMLRGALASGQDRDRFLAEAEAAARLNHPGIVPVYEVGELQGRLYFSMKIVPGITLAARLVDGAMDPREAAEILAQVARAVHYAHRHGVLHRDLKPSNILLDTEGDPHVSDFGLAKQESDANLTRTGAVLGTPAYMSPEQAGGARSIVGPASDVYSLGSILYYMLTGRPPFEANSPVEALLMVREQDPSPPRLVNSGANRDLELITLRCMQKPADLRYASAAALAEDLDAFLNDEVISARSGRFTQVLARMFRETHHATVLENWGLLWMWHSLVLLTVCVLTNALQWLGDTDRMHYVGLWVLALWTWAAVFWMLRRRVGPVMFVERQIAHVWAGSMVSIAMLFPLEWWLDLEVLTLSPVVGLISMMVFVVKAGILSGQFYFQAIAMLLTTIAMALYPTVAHLIFGGVSALCFFIPGLKYHRQRLRAEAEA